MDIGNLKQSSWLSLQNGRATHDRQVTAQMLSATNYDGPTFHTRSRTTQHNITEDLTLQPKIQLQPDITKVTDTPDATPKLLMEDRLQALIQMQRTEPFCKHISKNLPK